MPFKHELLSSADNSGYTHDALPLMSQTRYLTKSKFKLGMQCPTKLYYVDKKDVYANNSFDDPFLRQLAIGGFQVGELARQYFPDGRHARTKNYSAALDLTRLWLSEDEVTIFEAAFAHENYFVRTDIVVKRGNLLDLIEVKAKSCDFTDESRFLTKATKTKPAGVNAEWREHLQDVAFQKHVVKLARPELDVRAHLMLVDKTVVASTDGLNQAFRAATDTTGSRYVELRRELTPEDLSTRLLRQINVDACCEMISADEYGAEGHSFEARAKWLSDVYLRNEWVATYPSSVCGDCEFRRTATNNPDLLCGFRECWSRSFGWGEHDFQDATVLELWDYRDKDKVMPQGKIKLADLDVADIGPTPGVKPGLSRTERRWLQVEKSVSRDRTPFIDRDSLATEIGNWTYPLHFIDFETCTPAIPFNAGRRPYEGIAFQFSHHVVDENGRIEHRSQFLETTPGAFPNYEFVRELRRQLAGDEGSIFRYHNHENSFLCAIRAQLLADPNPIADRQELVHFIESIAKPRDTKKHPGDTWTAGPRSMIDMFDLVLRYYYDPAMGGSNSIKKVLPAILNNSSYLKQKYSRPIYGSPDDIRSLNFTEGKTWVEFDDYGVVIDPYHSLGGVFDGVNWTSNDYDLLIAGIEDINDGGAAMAAYGKLQYEDMTDFERTRLNTALLKYCELDTLAMVMIYEAWQAIL